MEYIVDMWMWLCNLKKIKFKLHSNGEYVQFIDLFPDEPELIRKQKDNGSYLILSNLVKYVHACTRFVLFVMVKLSVLG